MNPMDRDDIGRAAVRAPAPGDQPRLH